jgi:pimeloyl-ACP methyl ester carboxylesterase
MGPLAAAGLDVVAVDLRGYGDSDEPADGFYDLAAMGSDLSVLAERLGWSDVTIAGHDLGASVAIDLAHRRPDLVRGLFLMNHVIPVVDPDAVASLASWSPDEADAVFGYAEEQGHDADGLMQRLGGPEGRRAYIESFYTARGWCPPDAFSAEDLDRLVSPYVDARRLPASFRDYEIAAGRYPVFAPSAWTRWSISRSWSCWVRTT